jgi:hypothetical protein
MGKSVISLHIKAKQHQRSQTTQTALKGAKDDKQKK